MAAKPKSKTFTAYVYENDYVEIQKLVQQYPNIETGGDLFGLWQDDKSVVIQLFIGPGKECKRTATSFHQDVTYLQKVGAVITKEEGLCNVGEWHSHHQIGMPSPSGADKRTVLSNMPQLGLDRFVLFIASIESSEKKKRPHSIQLDDIKLRCFIFREDVRREDLPIEGKIVKIKENNPVHLKYNARQVITEGAEPPPKEEALEKKKEKKRKESEKQPTFGSKPPARNQSDSRDENKSPNRDWKENPSAQPKTGATRETTQLPSPSYPTNQGQDPLRQNQPRSNQSQFPPSQSQYPSNQGQDPLTQNQPRSNQGQDPFSYVPPRSNLGQVPSSHSTPSSNRGQVPSSHSTSSSNRAQVPSSHSPPSSNRAQVPSSHSQHRSNQGQDPSSHSQHRSNQGQDTFSHSQPRSSQGQDPFSHSQHRSNQGQDPFSHSQPNSFPQNPTAASVGGMNGKGYF